MDNKVPGSVPSPFTEELNKQALHGNAEVEAIKKQLGVEAVLIVVAKHKPSKNPNIPANVEFASDGFSHAALHNIINLMQANCRDICPPGPDERPNML